MEGKEKVSLLMWGIFGGGADSPGRVREVRSADPMGFGSFRLFGHEVGMCSDVWVVGGVSSVWGARIDDGLLLGESARNIVPDDADSVAPRFWKFVCTVSHASFISHFRAVRKYLFGFSSALVVTLSRGGAPESPTS